MQIFVKLPDQRTLNLKVDGPHCPVGTVQRQVHDREGVSEGQGRLEIGTACCACGVGSWAAGLTWRLYAHTAQLPSHHIPPHPPTHVPVRFVRTSSGCALVGVS